ncbi:MAG: class I tRNA ligase family protein, partial [Anaerolineales bacterium]
RFARFVEANATTRKPSIHQAQVVVNRLGRNVAQDIKAFKFNTALAKMMEALNTLESLDAPVNPAELRLFVQVLAPFAPFLAQSCWEMLDGEGSVHRTTWPPYDPALDVEQGVEMAVQVNGKLRGTVQVEKDTPEGEVRAAAEAVESVARHLEGKQVVKVIHVPNRTLNFVVKD